MLAVVLGAVISTLTLEGEVTAEGGDYLVVPFEVPAGTVEILFRHSHDTPGTTLDFGIEDPDGFRGWGGRLGEDTVIGAAESSRCYLAGPIQPGTWRVDIGKAFLSAERVRWTVSLEFRDQATLAPRPRAPFEPRVLERGARWYRGDFHVHSSESGDAGAGFDAIRDLARARGLDFVNLSDHNTVSQQPLAAATPGSTSATATSASAARGATATPAWSRWPTSSWRPAPTSTSRCSAARCWPCGTTCSTAAIASPAPAAPTTTNRRASRAPTTARSAPRPPWSGPTS